MPFCRRNVRAPVHDFGMKFDPQKHHRRSIRLKGYDYSQPGGYFVTIVTYRRDLLFGEIVNGETPQEGSVRLNEYGQIADECWRLIPDHFPYVELGLHVVMPNHLHGIIITNDENIGMATNSSPSLDFG